MSAILLIMLVALVGLGGLAAVVFAIVYAIANKKPGVALAAVLLPLGAIVTVGLLGALLVGRASYHVQGPVHTNVQWAINAPPSPPSPPHVSLPHIVDPITHMRAWVFFLPVAVLVLAFMAFRKNGCNHGGRGWGKAVVIGLMLVIGAKIFFASLTHQSSVVHGQANAQQELAEQVQLDVETAERKAIEAQHQIEDAQCKMEEAVQEKAAKEHGIEFKSMQELWEKLNQPRIKLESDDHGASMEAGVDGKMVKIEAPANGEAQLIVPISGETPESLHRSLARLERMVEQVSNMADQLSNAGTLVGKAMVVLNETIDQKRSRLDAIEKKLEGKTQVAEPAAVVKVVKESPPVQSPVATLVSDKKVTEEKHAADEVPADDAEPSEAVSNAARPDWVDQPSQRVGNVWREVLVTDEFATDEECRHQADGLLLKATYDYIRQMAGYPGDFVDSRRNETWSSESPVYPTLTRMGIGVDYIRHEIAKYEYTETVQRSFGPMRKTYVQVEFSPSQQGELRQRWEEYLRKERFAMVGVGAGSVLGLLGMAFGLLKVDTWTKGYYTKRLFLGVPAAIIGGFGLLVVFMETIGGQ